MEMITDLSIAAFAEAFADKIEDLEMSDTFELLSQSELAQIQNNYIIGIDLTQSIPDLFSDFGLNIQDYLPYNEVRKIINKVDFIWRGKYTVEALYEFDAVAANHFLLDVIGASASSEPNMAIEQLFESKGVKKPNERYSIDSSFLVNKAIKDLCQAFKKFNGSVFIKNDDFTQDC
jgi:hypothetical protein